MHKTKMIPLPTTLTLVCLFLVSIHFLKEDLLLADSTVTTWVPALNKDGIVVEVAEDHSRSLKAFRSSTIVPETLSKVLAVLRNVNHRKEWLPNSAETKILEHLGKTDYILYERTHLNLISDRDSVVEIKLRANLQEKRAEINFHTTTHSSMPERKGIVRMPYVEGHFYFYPEQKGKATKVVYEAYADPGGSLPHFLVNMAAKKVPYETLKSLKTHLQKPQLKEDIEFVMDLPGFEKLMANQQKSSLVMKE